MKNIKLILLTLLPALIQPALSTDADSADTTYNIGYWQTATGYKQPDIYYKDFFILLKDHPQALEKMEWAERYSKLKYVLFVGSHLVSLGAIQTENYSASITYPLYGALLGAVYCHFKSRWDFKKALKLYQATKKDTE